MGSQKKKNPACKPEKKFEKWFKRQFGSLPDRDKIHKLHRVRNAMAEELAKADKAIDDENRILSQWNAALYARYASENGFES